jgi:hypothetical protein
MRWRRVALNLNGMPQPYRDSGCRATASVHQHRSDAKAISIRGNRPGRIDQSSRRPSARPALFEAAHVIMTRVAKWSALKAWGVRVAHRRGVKCDKVALARKLATVLHRMWVAETDFRYTTKPTEA